jgi:hypothetical protein
MGWFISVLAIGIVAMGARYDWRRRRQREGVRVARPEISRWEEEGGSVAPDPERAASYTSH